MPDPGFKHRMGYYKMRRRTDDWVRGDRLSLVEVPGFGWKTVRALRKAGIESVDAIMTMPTEALARQIGESDMPCKPIPRKLAPTIEKWRRNIRRAWQERIGEPFPESWLPDDSNGDSPAAAPPPPQPG